MAKYIVEIPDEVPVGDELVPFDMCRPSWYSEAYEKGKADAEDEVWEFARRIICPSDCCENSISTHTKEIFNKEGWEIRGIFNDLSYQEAKAKYDAWKQEKEEIHVGDEVEDNDGTRGVVFDIIGTDLLGVCWEEERVSHFFWPKTYCRKTGRHFSEAERLLEALKVK